MAQVGGPESAHKFQHSRGPVQVALGGWEYAGSLLDYPNVPATIGMVLSKDPALIVQLSTCLSVEDLHDMIEVLLVDAHNERQIRLIEERKSKRD